MIGPMTARQAILIGAGIIGASIVGARALAPYEFTPGVAANGNPFLWRSNRAVQPRAERWLPAAPKAAVDAASSLPEYSERRAAAVRCDCVRPRGGRGSSHGTSLRTSRLGRPSAARGDPLLGA